MTLGHRVVILRHGGVEQVGPPLELYRAPANRFVAQFLGSPGINLWPGRLGDDGTVHTAGARVPVSGLEQARLRGAAQFDVGVRPEHVRLGASPADGASEARVLVVEPVGSDTIVTLECAGTRLVARAGGEASLEPGQAVRFTVEPDRALFFDADSGLRLA
jgi:multiple sugar transport system ATP-binding protein